MKSWTDPTNLRAKDRRHAALVLAVMALIWFGLIWLRDCAGGVR